MPFDSFVLTSQTLMNCPHGGLLPHTPSYTEYLINGATIWLHNDRFKIMCPLDEKTRCFAGHWISDSEWIINGGLILTASATVEFHNFSQVFMGIGFLQFNQTTVTVNQLAAYLKKIGK